MFTVRAIAVPEGGTRPIFVYTTQLLKAMESFLPIHAKYILTFADYKLPL
jgi:hypothetical protein